MQGVNSSFVMPTAGLIALCSVMAVAWKRQTRTCNAGIVDVIWSASFGLLAVTYAVGSEGWLPRRVLVGTLALLWSLRLTRHLAKRVLGEPEDGRYGELRSELGPKFNTWIFWFFQAQALLAVLLSLVFLVLMDAAESGWRIWDWVGVAIWVTSIAGEALADRQLRDWRENPENSGKTCRRGLWAYSRHPNYFFEWVHWLTYPVLGIGLPYGWSLWLAPLVMLFLVVKVTGIPPTEAQSIRSRGDDYRAYQRTTNAFFPGPTKADPAQFATTP